MTRRAQVHTLRLVRVLAAATVALCTVRAAASPTTISFDERLQQPGYGLSLLGVTFDYDRPFSLTFGASAPFDLASNGPTLRGETGDESVATIDFATPTTLVEFTIALTSFEGAGHVTVELFDAGLTSLGATTIPPSDVDPMSLFQHDGAAVSRVELSFEENSFGAFYLDDLAFLNDAANLVRVVGADGVAGTTGMAGGGGSDANAVASSGSPLEHAVARGGHGGTGGGAAEDGGAAGSGGEGGAAEASALAVTPGDVDASATAVAVGGTAGASGTGATPGAVHRGATAEAHASAASETGSAIALVEVQGGDGGVQRGTGSSGEAARRTARRRPLRPAAATPRRPCSSSGAAAAAATSPRAPAGETAPPSRSSTPSRAPPPATCCSSRRPGPVRGAAP